MRLPRGEVNSRPVGGAGEAGAGARGGARGVRAVPREVGPVSTGSGRITQDVDYDAGCCQGGLTLPTRCK
jgi:hypothetical protein